MKDKTLNTATFCLLVFAGFFSLFPFLIMFLTSFKSSQDIMIASLNIFPKTFEISNYLTVFEETYVLRFMLNGFIVITFILLGQFFVNIPAAYAFAKRSFPLKNLLFAFVLAALVFPRYIAAIPNFLLLSHLKLLNTYAALILPFFASSLCIFLLRQYIMTIPDDFFDAAKIEGCGIFSIITRILIPMIRPAIGSFAIFSIVLHWNDFFWPLIVIQKREMMTPPAGIVFFADAEGISDWGAIMAAAVLTVTPLIALFLSSTKQFIASLTNTGLKG